MLPSVHCITLAETPDKTMALRKHLSEFGISNTLVRGVNAAKWGLTTNVVHLMDGPGHDSILDQKHVGLCLSHWLCWQLMVHKDLEEMTILEDDCRFRPGFRDQYEEARRNLPQDWDMLFIGSAHTDYRNKRRIRGNIWEVWWPLTTHAYIVRRKALKTLFATQELMFAPIDLSLTYRTFHQLRVYTVLPRLADQDQMPLPP